MYRIHLFSWGYNSDYCWIFLYRLKIKSMDISLLEDKALALPQWKVLEVCAVWNVNQI